MRILQRGGNATDAGVATILAASVIEFSHFSFGGEVPILVKLRSKPVAVVEGMGTAPANATREYFVEHARANMSRDAGTAPDNATAQQTRADAKPLLGGKVASSEEASRVRVRRHVRVGFVRRRPPSGAARRRRTAGARDRLGARPLADGESSDGRAVF